MAVEIAGQNLGAGSAETNMAVCLFLPFGDPYPEKIKHCPKQAKCSYICQLKKCFISDMKKENIHISEVRLSWSMLICVLDLL